ncbi:MAG: hypothetical protein OXC92_06395 [Flavobacteriaceae bacterium]|nr:hypothetical protein [Flavobacteriaceae bacterium]MCY4216594.1 hypothetical protein [Flavobacteriaceae bacterium]
MLNNIKNINDKYFWYVPLLFILTQPSVYSQVPGVNKVNKKYQVWQINRINYNWPKRKRDFRPQLFYLFFSKYKRRNHNNWRQYVPIETSSNYVIRPQVETFRDTMASLLKAKSVEYAFQKISIGWMLHYKKQIRDKQNHIRNEIDDLSHKGWSTVLIEQEFEKINQYVDGIKKALLNEIEKQKGFSKALTDYQRLLNAIHANKRRMELINQNELWINKEPINTYVKTDETFSQNIQSITW